MTKKNSWNKDQPDTRKAQYARVFYNAPARLLAAGGHTGIPSGISHWVSDKKTSLWAWWKSEKRAWRGWWS